jgi:predicted DNA-binding protein (UPF0278 family)
MSDETKVVSAEKAGSTADDLIKSQKGPDVGGKSGEPETSTKEDQVPKSQYAELEKKLGEQGNELGEFRNFFNEIAPLLEKLDADPELTKAILEDKISPELIKAVSEGKVSLETAETVSKADAAVRKEMGEKAYKEANPEEVEARLEKKFNELSDKAGKEINKITSQAEEISNFKSSIKDFIGSHADFSLYATDIDNWLKKHPNIYDIEVAYQAVKGIVAEKRESEEKSTKEAEAAKDVAANFGGGASQSTAIQANEDLADKLISKRHSANIL